MCPAKVIGRNEMPLGRDILVIPSNTVLDRDPGPLREGEIWGSEPPVRSNAAYRQITLAVVSPIVNDMARTGVTWKSVSSRTGCRESSQVHPSA